MRHLMEPDPNLRPPSAAKVFWLIALTLAIFVVLGILSK